MTITGPTTLYHRTLPPRIVTTQAEYDALGEGWADTPAAFYEPSPDAANQDTTIHMTPKRKRSDAHDR